MSKSELIRTALDAYLNNGKPRRATRGILITPCAHRVRTGSYCRKCDRIV